MRGPLSPGGTWTMGEGLKGRESLDSAPARGCSA